jgi:hypothetical protein
MPLEVRGSHLNDAAFFKFHEFAFGDLQATQQLRPGHCLILGGRALIATPHIAYVC